MSTATTDNHDHPLVSILMFIVGAISYIVQDITADLVYLWVFRILSLISLISIILINRKKAWKELLDLFGRK